MKFLLLIFVFGVWRGLKCNAEELVANAAAESEQSPPLAESSDIGVRQVDANGNQIAQPVPQTMLNNNGQPLQQPMQNMIGPPLQQPTQNTNGQPLQQPMQNMIGQPLQQPTQNMNGQPLQQPMPNTNGQPIQPFLNTNGQPQGVNQQQFPQQVQPMQPTAPHNQVNPNGGFNQGNPNGAFNPGNTFDPTYLNGFNPQVYPSTGQMPPVMQQPPYTPNSQFLANNGYPPLQNGQYPMQNPQYPAGYQGTNQGIPGLNLNSPEAQLSFMYAMKQMSNMLNDPNTRDNFLLLMAEMGNIINNPNAMKAMNHMQDPMNNLYNEHGNPGPKQNGNWVPTSTNQLMHTFQPLGGLMDVIKSKVNAVGTLIKDEGAAKIKAIDSILGDTPVLGGFVKMGTGLAGEGLNAFDRTLSPLTNAMTGMLPGSNQMAQGVPVSNQVVQGVPSNVPIQTSGVRPGGYLQSTYPSTSYPQRTSYA